MAKNDVQFTKTGASFLLKVRQSCQASVAETWLKRQWGIDVEFSYGRTWYRAALPADLPTRLEAKLRERAKQ